MENIHGIVQQVSRNDFVRKFKEMGREENFTQEGLSTLFDYLENYADDIDEPIELDVICICCEYTEYKDFKDFKQDYDDVKSLKELQDYTEVIKVDKEGFIIRNY